MPISAAISIRGRNEEHKHRSREGIWLEYLVDLVLLCNKPIGYPISERNSTNIWSISAWLSQQWHRHGHGYMRKRERGRERYL